MTKYEFKERLNLELKLAKQKIKTCKAPKNLYFQSIYNEYLSRDEYAQIVAFGAFVEREKNLTDKDIEGLVLISKSDFPVIYDLITRVEDAIEELRDHGAISVALMYRSRKHIDTKLEEITAKEAKLDEGR